MIRLLMLDLDNLLVTVIARALSHDGVDVDAVRTAEMARERVTQGKADVALLDANLIDDDDFAALSHAVPVVLTSSFVHEDGRFQGVRVLQKPFTSGELLTALREALGPLDNEPVLLVDVLLRAHTQRESTTFALGHAELVFEAGELVHARVGALEGEPALAAILTESRYVPARVPSGEITHTITRPFRTVLFDALGIVDAREQLSFLRPGYPRTPDGSLRPLQNSPWRRGGPRT